MQEPVYTQSQVLGILMNLVNGIELCSRGDILPKRYKQSVNIDGDECWVTGRTLKDLLEAYLELCLDKGVVMPGIVRAETKPEVPKFGSYLAEFNRIYKSNQGALTKQSRDEITKRHIDPKWKDIRLDEITTTKLQEWFNELGKKYSHETLLKIRNNMSPALNSAVEDGYIQRNPFKSDRLVIGGTETTHHKAIPHEKIEQIRSQISQKLTGRTKNMAVLMCYLGLRFEEILGLRWEDLDHEAGWIHIQRAVVHPTRNQPEVKPPKSKTSDRRIPLPDVVWKQLAPKYATGYILCNYMDGGTRERPLTYTEARNEFRRIQDIFGLQEYTVHDFRDTCATEWREAGIPTDIIARLLGHSKSDITENRYVKYRDEIFNGVRQIMNSISGIETRTKVEV